MSFVNNKKENLLLSVFLIIVCITPYWILNDFDSINKSIIFYYFIYIFFFFIILFFLSIKKNDKLICFFYSLLIFYGLDNKLGLLIYFENFSNNSILKYFTILVFCLIAILVIYFSLKKNFLITKKIFLNFLVVVFLINFFLNFNLNNKYEKLEKLQPSYYVPIEKFEKKKTLIIILDEMMGYRSIDEKINFGSMAKKSYIDLFKKYNFTLFESSYSIYDNSEQAISASLNYDYNISKYNINSYVKKRSLDTNTLWEIKKNKFFEENNHRKIISNKNTAISYCNDQVIKCFRSNSINNYEKYIKNFNFNSLSYFLKKMRDQNSIMLRICFKFLEKTKFYKNYHYLTFNKAKFQNDLDNLSKIVKAEKAEIFLFHFMFPHRPFFFEIASNKKGCVFDKDKINIDEKKVNEVLIQHYKEIICTNYYLDIFLDNIFEDVNLEDINIVIMSDTGLKAGNISKTENLKNYHSVLFASKINNKKFNLDSTFISSQKLFYNFIKNKNSESDKITKIYDKTTNDFISIDESTFFKSNLAQ